MCGLVRPTGGTRPRARATTWCATPLAARRLVGLVPQEVNFDPFFTPREVLRFQMGYYGVPPDDARIDEVLRGARSCAPRPTPTRASSRAG